MWGSLGLTPKMQTNHTGVGFRSETETTDFRSGTETTGFRSGTETTSAQDTLPASVQLCHSGPRSDFQLKSRLHDSKRYISNRQEWLTFSKSNQHRLYYLFSFVHISQNDSLTLVPLCASRNERTHARTHAVGPLVTVVATTRDV